MSFSADSSPVDLYVERLLHAKLVPGAQVVKPWIRLAQVIFNEMELYREQTTALVIERLNKGKIKERAY